MCVCVLSVNVFFWYQLTRVVLDKGPLDSCCCCCYLWSLMLPTLVVGSVINGICNFVCLCLCPRSKRKMTWVINTKLFTHTLYGGPQHALTLGSKFKVTGFMKCAVDIHMHIDVTVWVSSLTSFLIQKQLSRAVPDLFFSNLELEWQIRPEPDFQIDCNFTNLICKTLRTYEWFEFLSIFLCSSYRYIIYTHSHCNLCHSNVSST